MIVDNARGFIDGLPNAETKAVQARTQDRKRSYEQPAQKPQDMVCYNCGSKDHFYRECPKRSNYTGSPQHQDIGQQYRNAPKGAGKGAPKGQSPKKGEKGAKGSGKRGKDGNKNQNSKGKGKKQGRPGARAAQ